MTTNNDDINVANNVAQANSQDLTEQWKNGELESGYYYIVTKYVEFPNRIDFYNSSAAAWSYHSSIVVQEVLAPVPSFEEWRRLQSSWVDEMGKAVDLQKALEWSNEQYNTKVPVLESENQQLKELLKECREQIYLYKDMCHQDGYFVKEPFLDNLMTKIDNTIGEKNNGD